MAVKFSGRKSNTQGPKGKAKVQIKGDKVRVILHEVLKDETEKEYKVILDKDNCPEYVKEGFWFVQLSGNLDKMLNIHPWEDMWEAHVLHFAAKEGEAPAPQTKSSQYGPFQVFYPIIELLSPEVKGMTAGYQLSYCFYEDHQEVNGEMRSVVGFDKVGSKFTQKTIEFFEATKVASKGYLPFSDNILPKLEKRILGIDAHFKVIFKKGYIDTIYESSSLPKSEEAGDEPF